MAKIKPKFHSEKEGKVMPVVSSGRIAKPKYEKNSKKKLRHKFAAKNVVGRLISENGALSSSTIILKDEVSQKDEREKETEQYLNTFCIVWNKYKRLKCTIFTPGDDWTSELIKESPENKPIPLSIRRKLKDHAKKLYQFDIETFRKDEDKDSKSGDKKYRKTMITHGTSRDKIAALVLQCIESPVHTLHFLQQLFNYCTPKERHHTEEVLDHLYKILNETYFPNKYVAREFECHDFKALIPLLSDENEEVQKQLLLWYFEDQLLAGYLNLISNLRQLTHDQLAQNKTVGVNALQTLITNHPYQCNEVILREMVDKLGDVVRKTAGQVNYHLAMLQLKHPDLKIVMVSMVEELLYRANISKSAQYYSLVFLRDMKFNKNNPKLAERMVSIYFDFFKSCIKGGDVDSKFMSAILSGLNRAFPHLSKERSALLDDQINILYKICHLVKFNIAVQALHLLYQVQGSTQEDLTKRFYQCVYVKILDPNFGCTASISGFLNLVFKCMSRDKNLQRIRAYIKRLLQVSKYQAPQVICSILYLISESAKDNSLITDLASFLTEKEEPLIREEEVDSDEEEEVKPDIDDEEDEEVLLKLKKEKDGEYKPVSSWVHRTNVDKEVDTNSRASEYDPAARNPEFCGAHLTIPWELEQLKEHYHPSVALFSRTMLDGHHVDYMGNPLIDFTFTRFLDRFIKRNPKQITEEDLRKPFADYKNKGYIPHGVRAILTGSQGFLNLTEDNVAAEDKFYHKFCKVYESRIPKRSRGKLQFEDVSDEEFDEYLRKTTGVDEEEADFAKNALSLSNKANMDSDEEEDGEEGFSGSEEEGDDEPTFGAADGMADDHADYEEFSDMDDLDFSDDEGGPKQKNSFKKGKGSKKSDYSEFDTDDFDQILEGNAYDDPLSGTSHAMANKDKASTKQLKWEENRADFMEHGDRKEFSRGGSRGSFRGNSRGGSRGSFRGNSRGSFGNSRGGSRGSFGNSRGSSRGSFGDSRGGSRGSRGGSRGSFGDSRGSRGGFRGSRGGSRGSFGDSRGSSRGGSRGGSRGSFGDSRGGSRGGFRGSRGSFGGSTGNSFAGTTKKSFSKSPKKPFGQKLKSRAA